MSHLDAILTALEHGFVPVEAYPGLTTEPWRLRRQECGHLVEMTLSNVRALEGNGKRPRCCMYSAHSAIQEMFDERGYDLLTPPPLRWSDVVEVRCQRCGFTRKGSATGLKGRAWGGECRGCISYRTRGAPSTGSVLATGFQEQLARNDLVVSQIPTSLDSEDLVLMHTPCRTELTTTLRRFIANADQQLCGCVTAGATAA